MTSGPGQRIDDGLDRGRALSFQFDGREIPAHAGESIAAALIASGITATRLSRSAMPRGYFCGMGVCWECLVTVDGRPNQRACMTMVEAGMIVQTSVSAGKS